MKADNGYKYLGNSYLNGATPANNYTPSKPISITLRQDTLPGKGNSISEDIRILNRLRPLLRSTDHLLILQAATVPDGSVHISTPKPENGISGISPGMIFLPGSNSRQETMNIDRM